MGALHKGHISLVETAKKIPEFSGFLVDENFLGNIEENTDSTKNPFLEKAKSYFIKKRKISQNNTVLNFYLKNNISQF